MSRPLRSFRAMLMLGALAIPGTLSLAGAARAQDVTQDQAAQLQQQLHSWLSALLGPKVPLADTPVRVTPEGDHFALSADIAGPVAGSPVTITSGRVTARAKPLDANRWSIDDLTLPMPLHIDNAKPGDMGVKSMVIDIKQQSQHGVLDTSLATTSTFDGTISGYSSMSDGPSGSQASKIDSLTTHSALQPAGNGHVNIVFDQSGGGLASDGSLKDGSPFSITAERVSGGGHANDVAFDQVGPMIRGLMDILPTAASAATAAPSPPRAGIGNPEVARNAKAALTSALGRKPATPASPPMTPEQKQAAHALLATMRNLLGGLDEQFALERINVTASGHEVRLDKMSFGIGFGAPAGRVDAHLTMAVDGLTSPDVPPGILHDYMPRHISLTQRVSGVPAEDVFRLIDHSIDAGPNDTAAMDAETAGLLAKGPLALGIDDLSLDLGPATLKGSGQVLIAAAADVKGQAELVATGLDEIIRQSTTSPELKAMGAGPVLFLLKGMGRAEGDRTIWDITYQDHKLLVNGQDLSGMIPGK